MSQELNGTLSNSADLVGTFGNTGGGGTTNYNDLTNKPQINGVELQGNKTTSNLNISYNDLTNKPTIPAAQVNSDWNSVSGVSEILNKPSLAIVATSGSYDDLTDKPTIPAAQVNSDWNSSSGVSEILNKPSLATVATSGSYDDLTDKPSIPVNSDFALSGLSDTDIQSATSGQVLAYDGSKWINSNAFNKLFPPNKTYPSGTASTTAIQDFITTYGTNTMMFGFVITGLGWFECLLIFHDNTQGGGILMFNGATPRLWALSYQNGNLTISEK